MTGRRARRSKNGCSTCRIRKVKCDEVRPLCARCRTSGMSCEWTLPATTTPRPKAVASRCPSSSRSSNALVLRTQRTLLPRDMFGFSAGQQLANSLHLSAIDREHLAYFPQCSVVRWVGKPWEWGFLRHLYSNFASQSSMVMRMILAVSASELENRRSRDPSLSVTTTVRGNPRAGVAHYSAALREFGGLLARCRDEKQLPSQSVIDETVTAMFFMVTYEHLFCGEQTGLAAHLSGVHAFLSTCGVLDDPNIELGPNFSHVTKNILLYIMYIGINFVTLGGQRQRDSWATAKDNTLFVSLLDNLYQDTRDTNSLVYQEDYPPEALLDDIAVFQPLEFIHECVKLRYLLLPLTSGVMAKDDQSDISHLSRKLTHLGKRYNNLVRISAAEKPPRRLRELQTIYYSASEYHALQIMLHRLGCTNTDKKQPKCDKTCRVLKELVANLTAVLKRLSAIDTRTLARVCWPLAVAAEVVEDPAELLWVQQTVETSRLVSGSSTVFTFLET